MAPMSLITYEDARPWARAIAQRVETRQMPPWHIDRTIGIQSFKNDRSLARRPDRHHRPMGGRGRAEGRSEGHASAEALARREQVAAGRQVRGARPGHQVRAVLHAGRRAGRLVASRVRDRSDGAALGPGDRDSAGNRQGPARHASCAGTAPAGREHAQRAVHQRPQRRRRRAVHGMGRRQERRRDASGFGASHAAGVEDRLGSALPRGRRSDHRLGRAGRVFLSEGAGAEASRGAGALQHVHRPAHGARHPAQSGHDHRELRHAQGERAHRELPGAHAPARQGHVDGSALSGWPPRDAEPGHRLQLQLAQHVHLHGRRGAAAAQGHAAAPDRVVRQHARRTSPTPTRISGSAGATARSTKWVTPG